MTCWTSWALLSTGTVRPNEPLGTLRSCYSACVWPVSIGVAAKVLGVNGPKLRRWINEGRFDDIDGLSWTAEPGFARRRELSRNWVEAVAERINAKPDWLVVEGGT